MTNIFPPPGNPAIIIFSTKPLFIKYGYELIDSAHNFIANICSSYEASVCVGVFLILTTGSQPKCSLIVLLSNSSRGGTWHLPCASPISQIAAWTVSLFNSYLNYSKTSSCSRSRAESWTTDISEIVILFSMMTLN